MTSTKTNNMFKGSNVNNLILNILPDNRPITALQIVEDYEKYVFATNCTSYICHNSHHNATPLIFLREKKYDFMFASISQLLILRAFVWKSLSISGFLTTIHHLHTKDAPRNSCPFIEHTIRMPMRICGARQQYCLVDDKADICASQRAKVCRIM